ncbi:MAG TPA: protein-L-isoaspartate(D-aspartate) O-methyltransferase [Candidatus Sulfotelmatobacter sp.]|jgi:protein-L-isoaspartate(D-aspartate) O-methyltransferase|nr:protein-L-isoaspartate(D-aspartate) O-methyltransferase [Candidatus Sulfotelmatobacter sp.]
MSGEARRIRLIMELRRAGVVDTRVLAAIERLPRELFVPAPFLDQAYENTALPIGQGQTVSQPLVVALMSQALEVGDRQKVLEIGTGSGYQAAVLARLCRRVYTIERHKPLLKEAEQRFKHLHVHNITAICGDGMRGWPEQAPFDRIMVTAAATEIPQNLLDQLSDEGVMVLPVGNQGGEQIIVRVRKVGGRPTAENLFPVRFVPLVGGAPPE